MARKHDGEALERRSCELRAEETEDGASLVVNPVVFNQKARIFDWRSGDYYDEMIRDSAVDERTDLKDVLLCVNHEYEKLPLARSKNGNGTLKLSKDATGLWARTVLDVQGNPNAAALYSAVKREDVTGASFMFRVDQDHWEGLDTESPLRVIDHISIIHEVSVVNDPAYPQTSVTARSSEEAESSPLEEARKRAEETARQSALELEKAKIAIKVRT